MRGMVALVAAVAAGVSMALVAGGCQRGGTAKPADCARVADTLATFELGTAAKPEQRAPVVAKHRAACESTRVTADEARCLAGATDTWAARACLPRMFPVPSNDGVRAGCAVAIERMREAVLAEVGSAGAAGMAAIDKMLPVFREACEQDGWPVAVLDCMSRAKPGDMGAFQACANQLPKPQQDQLAERLAAQQAKQAPGELHAGETQPVPAPAQDVTPPVPPAQPPK